MALAIGQILSGEVNKIQEYGAFITLEDGSTGLVHISEVSDRYIKNVSDVLEVGQKVNVKVIDIGEDGKKVKLSIKETMEKRKFQRRENFGNNNNSANNLPTSFEDILGKFVRDSEEKQCMINRRNDSRR